MPHSTDPTTSRPAEVYDVMAEGFRDESAPPATPRVPKVPRIGADPLDTWDFVTQRHDPEPPEPDGETSEVPDSADEAVGPSEGAETLHDPSTQALRDGQGVQGEAPPEAEEGDTGGVFDIEQWETDEPAPSPEPVDILRSPEKLPEQGYEEHADPVPQENSPVTPPPIEVYVHPRVPDTERPPETGDPVPSPAASAHTEPQDANEGTFRPPDAAVGREQDATAEPRVVIEVATPVGSSSDGDHGESTEYAPTVHAETLHSGGTGAESELPIDAEHPVEELFENEIDMTPVDPSEMTGIWLTTATGHDSPVWLDGEPADPDDLGVDPLIADRLRDWADMWNTQWDPDTGWLPRARITDYEGLGEWLARRVKDASGAVTVTLQPAHLGRSGVHVIPAPAEREPIEVRLANAPGARMPVWVDAGGEFVTEFGVGSFSSELNARLEAWAEQFENNMDPEFGWKTPQLASQHAADGRALAAEMSEELGPDYRVNLDLWEIGGG